MYNIGTVTTTANSTKLVGVGTKWKDNNSRVSAEQVILIQNGSTIYINSIASIQSNTEITLSFPVPASVSNAPYQILTTMVNSVSDAANKIVAMNVANVQFSDILNRWATESGTITVTLPDGTTQQLRTAKEMDKLLDGKFDKAGGVVEGGVTAVALGSTRKQTNSTIYLYPAPESSPDGYAYFQYKIGDRWFGHVEIPRPENGNTRLMQVGDYGIGGATKVPMGDISMPYSTSFVGWSATTPTFDGVDSGFKPFTVGLLLWNGGSNGGFVGVDTNTGELYVKGMGAAKWKATRRVYDTANTTKDSNGNLKAASPIVKVFTDHIETNDEAEGVTMQKLGIGHYLIKGVVGFNADGAWGINNGFVIPQDHNGKNMVLIDYEVKPDGDIELFVFHQQNADLPERFQNKRIKYIDKDGNPVYYENYEPCDVPESRWIDMRVEMPVNSIYNLKQAEAERLAKEEAERQAKEEAKKAELEAE
ncbi:cell envelope integrity protein TolA [Providencia stuartii]|uniref:cell envelope integrity protein TolA n=1 Tax=Providencia stuartii TaxID=588 RepID=UPI0018C757C3|nr:cell envelope integrity protein TolA [Providencia stuartii]MBG5896853.1 cell envelope integrity protein TolA [Providencia stuartii]